LAASIEQATGFLRPVLGGVVGADPEKRFDKWAPDGWRNMIELISSGLDYHASAMLTKWDGVRLDPIYEAKRVPFLLPGDLFWCVGIRATV